MIMEETKEGKKKKEKSPKPKYNMAQNTWFMVKLAWTSQEKKVIVLCLLSAALAVASNLVNLYVSPSILSAVERRLPVTELMLVIGGFAFAIMFLSAFSAYVGANTLYGRVTVRTEIVALINRKAATTSYPNVYDDGFQKLLTKSGKCVGSNSEATAAVWNTLTSLIKNIAGFVIYVCLLSNIRLFLVLIILAAAVTGYLISNYLNGYGYRHRDEEAGYERHMRYIMNTAEERYAAAKDIRIFGLRPWLEEMYDKAMAAYTAFQNRAQNVYIWARIADLVLAFLRNGIVYVYLIRLVLGESLSVSEFLLYFSAAGGFTGWVSGILGDFGTLYRQSLDISIVRECIEYREPFRLEGGVPLKAESDRRCEIRLEHVSFRYPGAEQDTLTDIDLTLHPGEKLAVVGLNGAGKTTLVKLICGFLDPMKGRVLLDGRDIKDYNRADYYTMFSAVFQSFSLLAGTIATNVAQEEKDIDMGRVKDCVEKAGLRAKVESLPDGYETLLCREIYEGAVMLSGGETQRLMLARALYKNAPILLLDEPTAALDPIAESEMYQKYNEMTDGRSAVYISHRLASTRFCDRIIMIENGRIHEEGTHEELLKAGGSYAKLYETQSKYYREGAVRNGEE